jgi:hypothetical protein
MAFTFKKVNTTDATTRPQITVGLKGKTKTISVSPIVGGNGAQLAHTTGWPAADTTAIGTEFTASFQVKDQYGNIASLSPNGGNCENSLVVNGFQSGVYANTVTTPTTTANSGLYSITANILKAATHNVTLSACGLSLTKTLTTNPGTVDRVMLTSTNAAPNQYSCENPDASGVCEVVHPTCVANATAECGPFYAWQFDQGGNILSNAASECQAFTKEVITGNDWDQQTTNSPHKFKVVSTATGKHLDGSVRCSQIANTTITKGTKIRFKAPTKVTPTLVCHPWGIDLAGQPEALCIIDNQTGYTMSSVSLRQCEQTTADTQCGTYSTTNEPAIDAIVSGHCYNLVSKETGLGIKGHKCSIKILGVDKKISPVLWAEFTTANGEQVQFNPTRPVRIPKVNVWPDKQIGNADNGLGSTCTNNATYPADQAAACDSANAGNIDTVLDGTKHGLAHYKTGRSGGDINCTGNTTNQRVYKVEYVAIGDPPPLWNDNDAEPNDFVEKLSSGTDVTFSVKDTCEEGTNLAQSERCKLKFEAQGPFFEGVFKVWPAKSDTDLNKGSNPYIIRTGESPICPVDGY